MVHWSLCAWSELNFSEMWYLNWLHLGEGRVKERAVHKSFLDIAASLPRTQFLPASLCLSSKLHNPCQSCLDCRLKVIRKQGGERMREGGGWRGEGGMERAIISSTWSSAPHTLMVITSCYSFHWLHTFFYRCWEQTGLACNYNAPSAENHALCEHIGEPIIALWRLFSPEISAWWI